MAKARYPLARTITVRIRNTVCHQAAQIEKFNIDDDQNVKNKVIPQAPVPGEIRAIFNQALNKHESATSKAKSPKAPVSDKISKIQLWGCEVTNY